MNDIQGQVKTICEELGAPFGGAWESRCTSKPERTAGKTRRLFVQLADDAPGWRAKDTGNRRRELKAALRAQFPTFAIHIKASYSRLEERDGVIVVKDNGRCVGVLCSM